MRQNWTVIVSVIVIVVALVFDLVLVLLGRLLLPWSRLDRRTGRLRRSAAMKAVTGA